jgi:hypothetical protein
MRVVIEQTSFVHVIAFLEFGLFTLEFGWHTLQAELDKMGAFYRITLTIRAYEICKPFKC